MTQDQISMADKLYEDGLNDVEIGNACGVSSNTIRSWRRRTDRPANYFGKEKNLPGEWTVYLAADDTLLAFGTTKECATALGMSCEAFYQLCSRARRGVVKKYSVYYRTAKELMEDGDFA